MLMDAFGGKARPLSDVFKCNNKLGSRRVTLVSLERGADGTMRCSDHFGFKATTPKEVLDFFNDPDGKSFLFPDNHMGPDLFCFVQDEETKELILLAVQAKSSPNVTVETWISALNSLPTVTRIFSAELRGVSNLWRSAFLLIFTEGRETGSICTNVLPNTYR